MWRESIAPRKSETGQTMAEYAVILGVITITIVATFSVLSGAIWASLQRVVDILSSLT
jgi:Flp pilus assembly pilin Flp